MPFTTPEKHVLPMGGDSYDYVQEQRAQSASIRSIVPVADQAEANTILDAMTADGRSSSVDNLLVVYVADTGLINVHNGIEWADARGVPLRMWRRLEIDSSTPTIPNGVWTTIMAWSSAEGAPLSSESGIAYTNGVMTMPRTGRWRLNGQVAIGTGSNTVEGAGRYLQFAFNVSGYGRIDSNMPYVQYGSTGVSSTILLPAGATIEAQVRQTTPFSQDILGASTRTFWEIEYVGQ